MICLQSLCLCGHKDCFLFLERTNVPANLMEVKTRMPNAKVLSEKQAIVASLTEKLQGAAAGVLVDYKGITVSEDTALRAELRKNNVEYAVVKNTLLRFAVNNCGMNELDDLLNGTTSLAICNDDPVAPARIVNDFAKKLGDRFTIKGGFMDGKVMPLNEVMALAEIPRSPFCVPRSWVPCWLPSLVWLVSSSRSPRSRVLPPRKLPLPSNRLLSTTTFY